MIRSIRAKETSNYEKRLNAIKEERNRRGTLTNCEQTHTHTPMSQMHTRMLKIWCEMRNISNSLYSVNKLVIEIPLETEIKRNEKSGKES